MTTFVYGTVYRTDFENRYIALANNKTCIRYAAAHLRRMIDYWAGEYSNISKDVGVLATLYNYDKYIPHNNPKPSPTFGIPAIREYEHVQVLLGLKKRKQSHGGGSSQTITMY